MFLVEDVAATTNSVFNRFRPIKAIKNSRATWTTAADLETASQAVAWAASPQTVDLNCDDFEGVPGGLALAIELAVVVAVVSIVIRAAPE